jgi:hypothetical protein
MSQESNPLPMGTYALRDEVPKSAFRPELYPARQTPSPLSRPRSQPRLVRIYFDNGR